MKQLFHKKEAAGTGIQRDIFLGIAFLILALLLLGTLSAMAQNPSGIPDRDGFCNTNNYTTTAGSSISRTNSSRFL